MGWKERVGRDGGEVRNRGKAWRLGGKGHLLFDMLDDK